MTSHVIDITTVVNIIIIVFDAPAADCVKKIFTDDTIMQLKCIKCCQAIAWLAGPTPLALL